MGDDTTVRRLLEILSAFYIEKRPVEEDLTCSITNEFLLNIQTVLLTKQSVILHRWNDFLKVCGYKMLFSAEMYLRYIIHACRLEIKLNFNIFEKFLGVFSLLIYLSTETRIRTEVDFCGLISDIFMVFYSSEMKKIFYKRGGFDKFAKYINNPYYISLKSTDKGLSSFCYPASATDVMPIDLPQQNNLLKNINFQTKKDRCSLTLAQNVLNCTRVDIPIIPDDAYLKLKLSEWNEETGESTNTDQTLKVWNEILQQWSSSSDSSTSDFTGQSSSSDSNISGIIGQSSSSGSSTSDIIGQTVDIQFHKNTIKAVIRYNYSKYLGKEKVTNRLQKEAYEVLERLKYNIVTCIEILIDYDEE